MCIGIVVWEFSYVYCLQRWLREPMRPLMNGDSSPHARDFLVMQSLLKLYRYCGRKHLPKWHDLEPGLQMDFVTVCKLDWATFTPNPASQRVIQTVSAGWEGMCASVVVLIFVFIAFSAYFRWRLTRLCERPFVYKTDGKLTGDTGRQNKLQMLM